MAVTNPALATHDYHGLAVYSTLTSAFQGDPIVKKPGKIQQSQLIQG